MNCCTLLFDGGAQFCTSENWSNSSSFGYYWGNNAVIRETNNAGDPGHGKKARFHAESVPVYSDSHGSCKWNHRIA